MSPFWVEVSVFVSSQFRVTQSYNTPVTAVMFWHIKIISILLCLMLFHQNASTTKQCPPGQRPNYQTAICENCPEGLYLETDLSCQACSKCKDENFSKTVSKCTPTANAVCRCKQGFTPWDQEEQTICRCTEGSGVDNAGTCTECKEGYFTDKPNTKCRQWRECKSGIMTPGNKTSDVVCKDASKEVTEVHTNPTLKEMTEVHTNPTLTQTTTTTISYKTPSNTTASSPQNRRSFYILWLVMVCTGIFLLMGLLYYICKATRCIHNHTKVHSRKESVCRKPVEESGEKCLSLLV